MITAEIQYDNKTLNCHLNKSTIVDELFVSFTLEETPQYKRLKLDVHPKQDIVLQRIEIYIKTDFDKKQDTVFCNGFLSSNVAKTYRFDEKQETLSWFRKPIYAFSSDFHIDYIPRNTGVLHSWTYGYHTSKKHHKTHFIGSLNESTGFTAILYKANNQEVMIRKDLENFKLTHSFPALDVMLMSVDTPSVNQAFDTYFSLQNIKMPVSPYKKVYTSGPFKGHISIENSIEKKLDLLLKTAKENDPDFHVFHIENGWQTHVGDWITVKQTVLNDMKNVVQRLHNQGIKASLSLSPFVVDAQSFIFKNKKDWILRGPDGQPLVIGFWTDEKLYALDFYHKDVQEYLTGVFHTILLKWGFDMMKIDYLYAVCLLPRPQKNRGQIMHEAMVFLRRLVGSKVLWAADVPLGSAFGQVDYCQICADMPVTQNTHFLDFFKFQKPVNISPILDTKASREPLRGRAFNTVIETFQL
jgi:alpha-galactosidase